MELVDREQDPRCVIAGHPADLDEQTRQIGAELTGIGRPEDRVDVDAQLGPVGDPQGERLQDSERTAYGLADPALGIHAEQDPAEGRRDGRGQVPVLGDLDVFVEVTPPVGQLLEFVQEHRLADAAQTGEELALAIGPPEEPLERDVHVPDGGLAADEGRWPGAGSWVVGVPYRVHAGSLPNYP